MNNKFLQLFKSMNGPGLYSRWEWCKNHDLRKGQ